MVAGLGRLTPIGEAPFSLRRASYPATPFVSDADHATVTGTDSLAEATMLPFLRLAFGARTTGGVVSSMIVSLRTPDQLPAPSCHCTYTVRAPCVNDPPVAVSPRSQVSEFAYEYVLPRLSTPVLVCGLFEMRMRRTPVDESVACVATLTLVVVE